MPRLEPFRGVRYDASVPLDHVIAPPYDVIDPRGRQELAERHAQNSVLVELPESDGRVGPYDHAAELLGTWERRGILRTDPEPSYYLYRMTGPDGSTTTGVIGALQLPEPDSDEVRPHEETLAKPLGDRLELLRATRANLSPIWLLSLNQNLSSALPTTAAPTATARDDDDVVHQLWRIEDKDTCQRIAGAVGQAPLVVADGHHRYQTALHYRSERAALRSAEDGGEGQPDGADLVMAYVVGLSPDQLHIGAIHRLLWGIQSTEALLDAVRARFDLVRAGPLAEEVVVALEKSKNLGLLTPEETWLLSPREDADGKTLDPQLIEPVLDDLEPVEVTFAHGAAEATARVQSGEAQAALLLRPVRVEQIARWAEEQRRMPPKTTYFYPKPRTGMVFRSLDA